MSSSPHLDPARAPNRTDSGRRLLAPPSPSAGAASGAGGGPEGAAATPPLTLTPGATPAGASGQPPQKSHRGSVHVWQDAQLPTQPEPAAPSGLLARVASKLTGKGSSSPSSGAATPPALPVADWALGASGGSSTATGTGTSRQQPPGTPLVRRSQQELDGATTEGREVEMSSRGKVRLDVGRTLTRSGATAVAAATAAGAGKALSSGLMRSAPKPARGSQTRPGDGGDGDGRRRGASMSGGGPGTGDWLQRLRRHVLEDAPSGDLEYVRGWLVVFVRWAVSTRGFCGWRDPPSPKRAQNSL